MSDWFDKLLDVGMEVYKTEKGVNQDQIMATVERTQQTGLEPGDPRLYWTDFTSPAASPTAPAPAIGGGIAIPATTLVFVLLGVGAFLMLMG